MVNSLNSYSNYNHTNLNSQNKQEVKIKYASTIKGNDTYRGKKFEYNPKIFGLDENISKKDMQEFNKFMKNNELKDPNKIQKSPLKNLGEDYKEWYLELEIDKMAKFTSYAKDFNLDRDIIEKAQNFQNEFKELLKEDLNLDKFKEKYLDFKQRHDEFVKEYEIAMSDKMMIKDAEISQIQNEQEKENFKPIQGKSKNTQTYQDKDTSEFFKKLLENRFDKKKQLELLFGTKFDDDKSYNELFNELFSPIRLNHKNLDLLV